MADKKVKSKKTGRIYIWTPALDKMPEMEPYIEKRGRKPKKK